MSTYADESTLYTSATTATEMTATLHKELQLVSEWVARLVLNICKTKSIVFGTNHSLIPKPQVTKLLVVTQDCKLSWSKHINTTVAKMGRNLFIKKASF